ncbi:MAG: hypothetical protein ACE5L6_06710 [Candidatus Bathyarchaeia archaeon]
MRATLTPTGLVSLKQRALRKRVWFKILDRAERAIVDLTIRTVKKIRSCTLKEMLMAISEKLMEGMESQVARFAETIGRPLAQKIASLAFSWGNRGALKWSKNRGFIQYLTITQMNLPVMYKGI